MLELFGSGYVIEHCISALSEKRKIETQKQKDLICIYYISDCLKIISENTAKSVHPGQEASIISNRLQDILEQDHSTKKDLPENGDEIVHEIIRKAGLKISKEGGEKE